MSNPLAGQRTLTSFFSKGAAAATTTTKAVVGDPAVVAMNKRPASASIGGDGKKKVMSSSSPTRAAAVPSEGAAANGGGAAANGGGAAASKAPKATTTAAAAPSTTTTNPSFLPPPPPPLDRARAREAANRACSVAKAAWEGARGAGKPSPPLGALLVEPSWREVLSRVVPGIDGPPPASALALQSFMEKEWAGPAASGVFPPPWLVFRALNEVPFDSARVVVIGQDPYHGPGQAEGLSFSVPRGQAIPPSLRNIHKELFDDGVSSAQRPGHGSLAKWAEQGVLLLNATLTVRKGQANSHQGKGWDAVTDAAVAALLKRERPAVFLLWGKFAEKKVRGACKPSLWNERHVVLTAPHPSGLSASRGFFGCKHFSKCNEALKGMGGEPVDWDLSTP